LDFVARHWGDLASLLGLALTIWFAYCAKRASEQARDAATAARDRIFSLDALKELTTAKMALSEIVRLQRLGGANAPWDIVLERYGTVRESFVRCANVAGIPETQRRAIGEAIVLLGIMVEDIERALAAADAGRLDIPRVNRILLEQMDDLERARIAIERAET
jgi:hypothetical protein